MDMLLYMGICITVLDLGAVKSMQSCNRHGSSGLGDKITFPLARICVHFI